MPYNLLSEPIRRYIRDQRWESFRPIQAAAIKRISETNSHYILASKTASGKTEAAFLPVLSQIKQYEPGVQVLYISPLIALINDQFIRVEELCKYLEVKITKWHGDSNQSAKDRLIREPSGILLITPESIESMFTNRPHVIPALFSNLKFVVIDEIHSFLGSERGMQLKSLLHRIKEKAGVNYRGIGLSATIGDFEEAKGFFGDYENTKVLRDSTSKETLVELKYFRSATEELSPLLIRDLYRYTRDNKMLVFPNNRGMVEEVAVKLKKVAEQREEHQNYFTHHSSVHKELREYAENFAKNNARYNFTIVCTSTLEMGVDIGSVDIVAQIDSAFSIASLAQRLGRSGRRAGKTSHLILYSTGAWSFLQSLACIELLKEGFAEPVKEIAYPADIMFHQALSILKETSGINKKDLMNRLKNNPAFRNIPQEDIIRLIGLMTENGLVENLNNELIPGEKAERIINNRSFYSVFKTETDLSVICSRQQIGQIPVSSRITEGENIFLAGGVWKVSEIDLVRNKVYVVPASDGKKPVFSGSGGNVHKRVREKILELLVSKNRPENCDEAGLVQLAELREDFSGLDITDFECQRPVLVKPGKILFYTFTGTKVNKTINFLLQFIIEKFDYYESVSMFELPVTTGELAAVLGKLKQLAEDFDNILAEFLPRNEKQFKYPKWAEYLDYEFKCKIVRQTSFDVEETRKFLEGLIIV